MIETKLNGQTLDVVAENVNKLRELFPEIVVEDKIDFDRLQDVLGNYIERNDESYRFNWYGKSDAFRKSQTPSTGTLRPCVEESKNWDTTENLYIEGDNLEVLKILEKSYSGKIKMIYIDPPYNKGKDFIYPDKWNDPIKEYKKITGQVNDDGTMSDTEEETEGGRHTKWLNMMYPRLRKARNLLTEDGVILISIDDVEMANLIRLCNDVFGEENFIGDLEWEATTQPINAGAAKFGLQKKTEPILMYAKNKNNILGFTLKELSNSLTYPHEGKFGKCRFEIIEKSDAGDYNRPTMKFKILGQEPREGKRWQIGEETARELERLGKVEIIDGIVKKAVYPEDELDKKQYKPFWSFFSAVDYGTALNGKDELNTLLETQIGFDTVKPVNLIKELVSYLGENCIILDFFSGSSTTAHSIIKLNSEDNGQRKFIMVQMPEKTAEGSEAANAGYDTICEIGKERIRRAGDKIKAELQEKYDEYKQKQQSLLEDEVEPMNPEDLDIGFKVFKLDSSNLQRWNLDVGENFYELSDEEQNAFISEKLGLFVNNFTEGRTELDMVYEIMLKYGLPLTMPIEIEKVFSKTLNEEVTLYNIGMGGLIVCLSDRLSEDVADGIVKLVEETEPATVRVVVKDFNFITDAGKTNFKETLRTGVESYFAKTDNKANNENQFEFITI